MFLKKYMKYVVVSYTNLHLHEKSVYENNDAKQTKTVRTGVKILEDVNLILGLNSWSL